MAARVTRVVLDMAAIKALPKSKEMTDALYTEAEKAAEDARRRAPVETGRLRDSIEASRDGDSVRYGSDVEYAAYVELGTSRMAAEPYLRPALDAIRGD